MATPAVSTDLEMMVMAATSKASNRAVTRDITKYVLDSKGHKLSAFCTQKR